MILVDSSVWVDFFNDFNSPEKKELEKYMVAENGLMLLQKDRDFKNIKRFYPSLQLVEIYTVDTLIEEEDQSEES